MEQLLDKSFISDKDDFKFYINVDLSKSEVTKEGEMILEGLAGDGGEDTAGESLDYDKFDLSRMFYVNWEHSEEPQDFVGIILKKELKKDGKLFIRVKLFNNNKKAKDIYELQKNLEENGGTLGFSVEGKVRERDPINSKVVIKADLFGVAICKVPVNPVTYAKIVKALKGESFKEKNDKDEEEDVEKMDTGDMTPVLPESVEKKKSKKDTDLKQELSKAEIYSEIFTKFTTNPDHADMIYKSILLKISNGMAIDLETIKKAEEILGIVDKSAEEEKIEKGNMPDMKVAGEENGGDIQVLKKAMDDAKSAYELKKSEYEKMAKASGVEIEIEAGKKEEEEDVKKSLDADLIKSVFSEVIKNELGGADIFKSISQSIDVKTKALGEIIVADREQIADLSEKLEKANTAIEEITQYNSDFRERLNMVEKEPVRRAVTSQNHVERFEGDIKKSENAGVTKFDLKNPVHKDNLIKSIDAKYGHDLSEEKSQKMMQAAASLQMTGSMTDAQANMVKSVMGIEIL